MKNKGFTLIELMIVIVLVGSIGTLATVSYMKSIKATEKKECTDYMKTVEKAVKVYVNLSAHEKDCFSGCKVLLKDLVDEGLLDENDDLYIKLFLNEDGTEKPINIQYTIESDEEKVIIEGMNSCNLEEE